MESNENKEADNEVGLSVSSSESLNLEIGKMYSVKRVTGEWHSAEVLEKRELKSKQIEYFVHFENCKNFAIILDILSLKLMANTFI